MRTLIAALLIILISLSCHSPVPKNAVDTTDSSLVQYNYDTLEGAYIGDFGGSDIRIVLSHVTGKHAIGYNLLKGLRRNISGTMQQTGNTFTFQLNEPGDHPFDGKFNFTIDTATFVLSGTWTPLNDKGLTSKTFTLKRIIDTADNPYENFTTYADSIGSFCFTKTGICVYEFYPVVNGKSAEQLVRVKGTWSLKDSVFTVDWEQNNVFPSRRSTFVHRPANNNDTTIDGVRVEYISELLIGEGRILGIDEP